MCLRVIPPRTQARSSQSAARRWAACYARQHWRCLPVTASSNTGHCGDLESSRRSPALARIPDSLVRGECMKRIPIAAASVLALAVMSLPAATTALADDGYTHALCEQNALTCTELNQYVAGYTGHDEDRKST